MKSKVQKELIIFLADHEGPGLEEREKSLRYQRSDRLDINGSADDPPEITGSDPSSGGSSCFARHSDSEAARGGGQSLGRPVSE
jgi:hypothetical protein